MNITHRSRSGSVVAIIPARFASTRLPGKPLLAETGKPLVLHVVEAARRARTIEDVVVATDDRRILDAVNAAGGKAVLTRPDHPSGTDRIAEVAAALPECRIVVNLQGDEPEIAPEALDRVVRLLEDDPTAPMATLAAAITDPAEFRNPNVVKVVRAANGRALYFSRSPIPYQRDSEGAGDAKTGTILGLHHLGLYAYRRDVLLRFAKMPPSSLERTERLEQLRALEAGLPIAVGIVPKSQAGIDTPEDYRRFVARVRARQNHAA